MDLKRIATPTNQAENQPRLVRKYPKREWSQLFFDKVKVKTDKRDHRIEVRRTGNQGVENEDDDENSVVTFASRSKPQTFITSSKKGKSKRVLPAAGVNPSTIDPITLLGSPPSLSKWKAQWGNQLICFLCAKPSLHDSVGCETCNNIVHYLCLVEEVMKQQHYPQYFKKLYLKDPLAAMKLSRRSFNGESIDSMTATPSITFNCEDCIELLTAEQEHYDHRLNAIRHEMLREFCATLINRRVRVFLGRRQFLRKHYASIVIQRLVRRRLQQTRYKIIQRTKTRMIILHFPDRAISVSNLLPSFINSNNSNTTNNTPIANANASNNNHVSVSNNNNNNSNSIGNNNNNNSAVTASQHHGSSKNTSSAISNTNTHTTHGHHTTITSNNNNNNNNSTNPSTATNNATVSTGASSNLPLGGNNSNNSNSNSANPNYQVQHNQTYAQQWLILIITVYDTNKNSQYFYLEKNISKFEKQSLVLPGVTWNMSVIFSLAVKEDIRSYAIVSQAQLSFKDLLNPNQSTPLSLQFYPRVMVRFPLLSSCSSSSCSYMIYSYFSCCFTCISGFLKKLLDFVIII
jgi:hypothetical protein